MTHRVAVRHKFFSLSFLSLLPPILTRKRKRRNDFAKSSERFIDIGSFFQTLSSGACRISPLRTCQVNQATPGQIDKSINTCQKFAPRRTHLIRDTFSVSKFVSTSCLFIVNSSVNTACDREEVSFIFVAATVRALLPSSMSVIISW